MHLARQKILQMPSDVPDPWHSSYKTYYRCMHLMSDLMPTLFANIDKLSRKSEEL